MTWLQALVEGHSDVAVLREILERKFSLKEQVDFKIHPHQGKGRLPSRLDAAPDPKHRGLLDQLPAKLRAYGHQHAHVDKALVLVIVDVDGTPCHQLLKQLNDMLLSLPKPRPRVMFRLAIEETESWFIADHAAVKAAYPKANVTRLRRIPPDAIVGAAEKLAESLALDPNGLTGADKVEWGLKIAPHLNLEEPKSPSLGKLLEGLSREVAAH